jgi:hypothetical protein
LSREVAEQFPAVINPLIMIAVKGEPGVVSVCSRPCQTAPDTVAVEIEVDAARSIGESEAVARDINQDGRGAGVRARVALLRDGLPVSIFDPLAGASFRGL